MAKARKAGIGSGTDEHVWTAGPVEQAKVEASQGADNSR